MPDFVHKALRNFIKSGRGQALVEMALVLPLLIILFCGVIEFGRIFGAYMVVNNLSREGARYGVVGHDDDQIRGYILAKRVWLNADNLTIMLTPPYTERDKGDSLEVDVAYSLDLQTPVIAQILPNPLTVSAKCLMRVE